MQQWLKAKIQTIKIRNRKIKIQLREERAILLICFGIALSFWLMVKLSRTYTAEKPVVLRFELPEDKVFSSSPPDDMHVQLSGRGWELMIDYLYSPQIILYYKLSNTQWFNLNKWQLRNDISSKLAFSNIQIKEASYDDVALPLENKIVKKIPIHLNYSFSFAPGYQLQGIQLSPDSLKVSGPGTLLDTLKMWQTAPLALENLKSNTKRTLALRKPTKGLAIATELVEATVLVEQFTEKSIFVPLMVKNAPDSLKIFPELVKLTCVVGLSQYNAVNQNDFQVEIDLAKIPLNEGKNTVPIVLKKQPDYVTNVQFAPKSAEFFILKK